MPGLKSWPEPGASRGLRAPEQGRGWRQHPAADVGLRGLRAVAAGDRLARRACPRRSSRARRPSGRLVGVARPAPPASPEIAESPRVTTAVSCPGAVGECGGASPRTTPQTTRIFARTARISSLSGWLAAILPSRVAAVNRAPGGGPYPSRRKRRTGICARSRVPRPGGLSSTSVPSSAATRSASPRRPEPSRGGAADAVVGHLDRHVPFRPPDGHRRLRRPRVLARWQRLGDDEVRGALDRPGRRSLAVTSSTGTGARARRAPRAPAPSPRSVSTAGWMPRASSRSSSRLVCSSPDAASSSSARAPRSPRPHARRAQQQRRARPARMRAVVEVALEPPALGVAGLDEPCPRRAQLLDARPQLVRGG